MTLFLPFPALFLDYHSILFTLIDDQLMLFSETFKPFLLHLYLVHTLVPSQHGVISHRRLALDMCFVSTCMY
jgi:hypothetical protein